MSSTLQAESPLYSTMGTHREYGPLVTDFVSELPKRIHTIKHYAETQDWPKVAMQAQQMKTMAGTYGFFELTESARRLETVVGHGYERRAVMSALDKFVSISGRCKPGVPS
jgi:HPt (histidine-containing phosphotransfer) domain-containing protein